VSAKWSSSLYPESQVRSRHSSPSPAPHRRQRPRRKQRPRLRTHARVQHPAGFAAVPRGAGPLRAPGLCRAAPLTRGQMAVFLASPLLFHHPQLIGPRFGPPTIDSLTPRELILYPPTGCKPSCGRSVTPQQHGVSPSYTFVTLPGRSGSALGFRGPSGWHLERPKGSTSGLRLSAGDQPRRELAAPTSSGARPRAPETRNPRNRWHGSRVVTPNEGRGGVSTRHVTHLSAGCQGLSRHRTGGVCPDGLGASHARATTKGGSRAEAIVGGA